MIKYAEVNSENIVTNIIISTEAQIQLLSGNFIKFGTEDTVLRKEAVISGKYDLEKNMFLAPKPYPSWTLSDSGDWIPPVERPAPGNPYMWDEDSLSWMSLEEVNIEL
jgi:hypothetical protein